MNRVLDSSALISYLEKEPGFEKVKDALSKAAESGKELLMCTVNWGEVYYILIREYGLEKADFTARLIETFPIEFVPADMQLVKEAALFKSNFKLPYADSFVAALAKVRKADILTADKEFKLVAHEIKISWV